VSTRLGVSLNYSGSFSDVADDVVAYEAAGADIVMVAEVYSFDAISQLGYLAAVTSTITLSTGILPIYSRTPTLIAMTAAGIDDVSGGRFELGLGSSGAQVIEGFHGVPFTAPLGHIRETVEICRQVWRREPVIHDGRYYQIPLPADQGTGLGKPLKLINRPVRSSIPVTIAALTQKAVEQAAEIAEGWLPIFYFPERAENAWGAGLAAGKAKRDPALGELDVIAQAPLLIGDSLDEALESYRNRAALYIGGMGARGANFYNDLATRYGYGNIAAEVQELYLTGQKQEAADLLPNDLVRGTALIGNESFVRERVAALEASGVTTILVEPLGATREERVEAIRALKGILA
jgi:F420-dependent oxidoreductase-like protein